MLAVHLLFAASALVNAVLFFCVLSSGVLIRWFHQGHLVSQISYRSPSLYRCSQRPLKRRFVVFGSPSSSKDTAASTGTTRRSGGPGITSG